MAAAGPSSPNEASAPSSSAAFAADDAKNAPMPSPPTPSPPISPPPPSYAATKNSAAYLSAASKLRDGDFEGVLSEVETALGLVTSVLEMRGDSDVELHPSLAPLYYMYGTALLYSVEECDDSPENQVMVGQQSQSRGQEEGDAEGGDDDEGGRNDDGGEYQYVEAPPQEQDAPAPPTAASSGADADGDLQIAWENLETARSILARISCDADVASAAASTSASASTSTSSAVPVPPTGRGKSEEGAPPESAADVADRVLDLAQIHARLGDLQRANGKYLDACDDYGRALDVRTRVLGRYHRKVADGHFRLAAALLLAAAEAEKDLEKEKAKLKVGGGNGTAAAAVGLPSALAAAVAAAGGDDDDDDNDGRPKPTREEIDGFRAKSMEHHLACGRAFGGLIAGLCGADPDAIASDANPDETEGADPRNPPSTASDGFSLSLAAIRRRVSELAPVDPSDADAVDDARELLDEIQEAVDGSEGERKALRSVAEMRVRAEAAAANEENDGGEGDGGGEGVTTVGFGPSAALAAGGSAGASDFTAVAAAPFAASASAPPTMMMVVKKKKKRPVEPVPVEPAAAADELEGGEDDKKRARTM